ncbi:hypothetical protein L1080_029310 [Rhodococcus sp. MSC1_016]|jgi:hypothetical protein|uniref:hypothetical protein n=1 Tax=Rhodococcus sp. MSC1_016 TaxID=2909266 RepID=UPI00202EC347|nr:hypothetical protein [Rhodococcus sp. MSC1_016]
MDTEQLLPTDRRRLARTAVESLGTQRSDHAIVRVTCPASHRVATVYRTDEGPVVVAGGGPGGHGSRDRAGTGHHGDRPGTDYIDMLDASRFEDDQIPARCACGSRTLSRTELRQAVQSHTHAVSVP